jgi:2-phospho-L-lactate guanylyltransferase
VVCDDAQVATWAQEQGAVVVWTPDKGLDGAVERGVAELAHRGHAWVIVAHADLPLAGSLAWVARFPGVTLIPDRRDDGTNVIALPTATGFRFAYGPGSFHRHGAEARRLLLPVRVVREPKLGVDVDVPADLARVPELSASPPSW